MNAHPHRLQGVPPIPAKHIANAVGGYHRDDSGNVVFVEAFLEQRCREAEMLHERRHYRIGPSRLERFVTLLCLAVAAWAVVVMAVVPLVRAL